MSTAYGIDVIDQLSAVAAAVDAAGVLILTDTRPQSPYEGQAGGH